MGTGKLMLLPSLLKPCAFSQKPHFRGGPCFSSPRATMVTCKAIRVNQLGGPEAAYDLSLAVLEVESGPNEALPITPQDASSILTSLPCVQLAKSWLSLLEHQVLKYEDVEVGEPREGEVRVKHNAIGVNFIDVYFRTGVYKAELPFTPGREAVGVVTAVGPGLTGRKIGDRVAYAGNPMGSYAEEQILPANSVVPVPPSVDSITAAAIMLKGMTAQCLLRRCFQVQPGHTILVHAAAGGVGSLLCQWGRALGAIVIGTVSTKEKAAQAIEDGCNHVILYKDEHFVDRVKEITKGEGVQVVYDSVGKDTFQGSLDCLAYRGHMVSFGESSGLPDPMPISALASKSLFLTRPGMMHYVATRDELLATAGEVFANVASGILKVRVNHTYPLSQAAQAHKELESRKTSGCAVLIPDSI